MINPKFEPDFNIDSTRPDSADEAATPEERIKEMKRDLLSAEKELRGIGKNMRNMMVELERLESDKETNDDMEDLDYAHENKEEVKNIRKSLDDLKDLQSKLIARQEHLEDMIFFEETEEGRKAHLQHLGHDRNN